MSAQTEVTEQRAAKPHRCTWCWERIGQGETYKRYRYFDSGDAGTVKMHPECFDAMREWAREEGGFVEWTPGMERPVRAAAAPPEGKDK